VPDADGPVVLVGILAGAAVPLLAHAWVVARMSRRTRSKYLVESGKTWVHVLMVVAWLSSVAFFAIAASMLASLAFDPDSAAWSFSMAFGLGFGMTALLPGYEAWLHRRRRRLPKPTDEEIEAGAPEDT
jgi:hypothetical protein